MQPQEHKELDKNKLPFLIAFDTEDDSKGNVISWAFAWYAKNGKLQRKFTKDAEEARYFIRNFPKTAIFIAHNLEYDIVNTYRDIGFSELEEMSYTARMISAKIKGRKHRFIDSFNFFTSSLKEMGKAIGLEKLPFDPNSQEYAERDPEIVLKFITPFRQYIIDKFDIDVTNTIGGLSMKIFLENYLTRSYVPFNEKIALDAFYGGRCEVFWKGPCEKVSESDINSEYPACMTKEFPDTSTIVELKNIDARFGVARCTVKTPDKLNIPVLPYRIDGKLIFPLGTFTGTWTFAELKAAKKRGYKILKVHESYGTDIGCYPFKKFMEDNYSLRLETENELYKIFLKLLMNNLYGKLVTHKDRAVLTHGPMNARDLERSQAELQTTYGNIHVYKVPLNEPPPSANYIWGAYVTSYGRLLLLENLEKVDQTKGTTLAYCDTDSVSSFGNVPELDYDEKRLGALKSAKWDKAVFYMPKGYILARLETPDKEGKVKVTCKGIPQPERIKEEGKELTLENPRMQFLELGRATFEKPMKLRQSFPQKRKANVWSEVQKNRKLTNDKRRVSAKGGRTFPLWVEDAKMDVGG